MRRDLKISEMPNTERLKSTDAFPLLQNGQNKIIYAMDLVDNIANAIANQHHDGHCHEKEIIEKLNKVSCQAAEASKDAKVATATSEEAKETAQEALDQSDEALEKAKEAISTAKKASEKTEEIDEFSSALEKLKTKVTNLNTLLSKEEEAREEADTDLENLINNVAKINEKEREKILETIETMQETDETMSSQITDAVKKIQTLRSDLDKEETDRESADLDLQAKIVNLGNIVTRLQLSVGTDSESVYKPYGTENYIKPTTSSIKEALLQLDCAIKDLEDYAAANYVLKAGDTMTGKLINTAGFEGDVEGNATTASYPAGFSAQAPEQPWGIQDG